MRVDYNLGLGGHKCGEDSAATGFDPIRAAAVVDDAVRFGLAHNTSAERAPSADLELAMHQDFSRLVMLMGVVLEHFLDRLLSEFPYEGVRLTREQKEQWFKLAFDEQTVSMHRLLMRRTIEGKPVSLGELTEIVSPQNRTSDFNKKRRDVRNKYLRPMEEMWLWNVNEVERTNRHGEREIARYEIMAGPALKLFSKGVFMPLRREFLKQLTNRL